MIIEGLSYLENGSQIMENKEIKKKSDEVFEENEKAKKEKQKKQNIRLAERKGQRPAFPFKRKSL